MQGMAVTNLPELACSHFLCPLLEDGTMEKQLGASPVLWLKAIIRYDNCPSTNPVPAEADYLASERIQQVMKQES